MMRNVRAMPRIGAHRAWAWDVINGYVDVDPPRVVGPSVEIRESYLTPRLVGHGSTVGTAIAIIAFVAFCLMAALRG